jgi:hypothetical protein
MDVADRNISYKKNEDPYLINDIDFSLYSKELSF